MAERTKKINKNEDRAPDAPSLQNSKHQNEGKNIEQMAIDEILREINLKSIRAKEIGPSGWLDSPVKRTNKRFLGNTLKAVIKHNARKADNAKFQSEKKLLEMDYKKHPSRRPKFGERKFLYKKPSTVNSKEK